MSKQPTPALPSSGSESDSDTYVGGRRDILTKKQRRHQLQVAAGLAPPSQSEVRFSTRRSNKVTNYNEDEEDGEEDDELVVTPNYYAAGVEDDTPAIDVVLNHEMLEDRSVLFRDPQMSRD